MARKANSGGARRVSAVNTGASARRTASAGRSGAEDRSRRREPARAAMPVRGRAAERSRAAGRSARARTEAEQRREERERLRRKREQRAGSRGGTERSGGGSVVSTLRRKLLREGDMDYTMLFLIILIVAIGLIVMLSASAPAGSRLYNDSYYFFKRQLIFIVVGFAGMFIISGINLDSFLNLIPKAFIICVILLILVLIPGIGAEFNGARRWLNIPFIQLQPSELMKPVIAMYIAYLVKMKVIDLKTLRSNLFCLGIIGIVALLLMLETHLSGTIVIVGIACCVMIAGGTPVKPLIIGGIAIVALMFIYLQFDPTRMARITSLLDPFADSQTTGYQVSQSIYAIGSGRLFGLGLGQSVQKYSNLPEPYNDFIFSIICEELGFFGATVIILLFAALFLRAIRIAINAPDVWSTLTCIGIAAQLGIQTFLNMGVAVSIIPNTGISLPFFSYGGTSILTLLLEMGILLNVSRKTIKK